MATPSATPEASEITMWQWIPTSEFKLPAASIQTTFKTRAKTLLTLSRFWKKAPAPPPDVVRREDLKALSTEELDRTAPPIDWKNYEETLTPLLKPWRDAPAKRFVVVLNIPHSGNTEILKHWAVQENLNIIDPPKPSDLLKFPRSEDAWLDQFPRDDTPWVLPDLEQCWLRHETGLGRIRKFYEQLVAGRLGYGIIGCDSWAWSFFHYALGFSAPWSLVAKPMEADPLARWLGMLVKGKNHRPLQYRQSDTGRFVLASEAAEDKDGKDSGAGASPFLRDLAAFSYGIPGVAHAYWRKSLQSGPDTLALTDEPADSAASTIWVKPWMQVDRPGLPGNMARLHAFILHSLLLHNGLNMDTLSKLMPMRQHYFGQALYDLSDKGLIECENDRWRVSAAGYPVVRRFLKSEGFLTDDFI